MVIPYCCTSSLVNLKECIPYINFLSQILPFHMHVMTPHYVLVIYFQAVCRCTCHLTRGTDLSFFVFLILLLIYFSFSFPSAPSFFSFYLSAFLSPFSTLLSSFHPTCLPIFSLVISFLSTLFYFFLLPCPFFFLHPSFS